MTRPYVVLSVAVSVDGCIDDGSSDRLLLSNAADFDRVDQVRAESDAIMIGAQTLRRDNPRLLVKSEARRRERVAAGRPANLLKITVTHSGNVDPQARMFHDGVEAGLPLVYTTDAGAERIGTGLGGIAEVVSLDQSAPAFWEALLDDVGGRGVERLLVEGGSHLHTAFLSHSLADELHMAIAPVIVGETGAPRFLNNASYPTGRMRLADVRQIGDVALLRYLLTPEAAP